MTLAIVFSLKTRMHSSRMRTAHGSSHPRGEGGLPQCMLGYTTPPRCGPGDPPGVDLETPHPRCGPGDPPPGRTLQLASWVWAWRPPCKAYWDTTCRACWNTTPPPPLTVTLGINGALLWHMNIQFLLYYLCFTELGDEVEFDQEHKEDSESLSEETFETELSFSVTQTPKVSCTNTFTVTAEVRR